MCGIAGLINFNGETPERALLSKMGESIRHRGPEAEGFFAENGVGFVHRRLRIIDVAGGDQPIFNQDGSVLIILNGEIYNYEEIRSELVMKGVKLKTKGDTEVILKLYEECGDLSFLDRLNGMFVFAIHDKNRKLTWIARDRTGEKPLYFHQSKSRFVFGSEVQAVRIVPRLNRELDPVAVDAYFHYGYIPAPLSIYQDTKKLEPGHYLRITDSGDVQMKRYWEIPMPAPDHKMTEDDCFTQFESLLSDSVRLRMVADVPFGAFLSGGVDSSTVVALMQQHTNMKVKTFTIGFKDSTYNESENSNRVAKMLKTEHHEKLLYGFNVAEIPEILSHFGEPYADSSAIPTYYLSKATREHVKVSLSGDGADEILGGYNRYVAAQMAAPYLKVPKFLRPDLALEQFMRLPENHGYYGNSSVKKLRLFLRFLTEVSRDELNVAPFIFGDSTRAGLYSAEFKARLKAIESKDADPVRAIARKYRELDLTTQMLWTDFHTYMPDDIHVKVDRMSMAHALEVRTPFMDHRLIEFLSRVPLHHKIDKFHTKKILRRLMAKYLGDENKRPKHGFVAPVAHWITGELKGEIESLFAGETARKYFNPEKLKGLLQRHSSLKEDLSSEIWTVYCFLRWATPK